MPDSAADLGTMKGLPPDLVASSLAQLRSTMKTHKAIVLPNPPGFYYKSPYPQCSALTYCPQPTFTCGALSIQHY